MRFALARCIFSTKTCVSPQRRGAPQNQPFCCCALALAPCTFSELRFCCFLEICTTLKRNSLFLKSKKGLKNCIFLLRVLAGSRSHHKIIKNIICLKEFLAKMELSLKRRASDVRRLIAGVANPFARMAMGSPGPFPIQHDFQAFISQPSLARQPFLSQHH